MTRLWRWRPSRELLTEGSARADQAITRALERGEGVWSDGGAPETVSRSQIQRLMREGRIVLAATGAPLGLSERLSAEGEVEARFPPPAPAAAAPEDLPISLLFQDEHLVIVDKPPGLTVHPSSTQASGTLVNALLHLVATGQIDGLSGIGGELRPGIVHRLDKDTSGVLVVTKTDVAHRALVETFAAHDIERVYWALCYGAFASAAGRVESTLGRDPRDRLRMAMNVPEGRRAVTHYRQHEAYGEARAKPFASWAELRLETGRTHQIRVHLTSLGRSLLGDPVYGVPTARDPKWLALPPAVRARVTELPGQALHARSLGFRHPISGEKLRFESDPPAAFRALHAALSDYV